MHVFYRLLGCVLLTALAWSASAQELVYKPINPNFGGNPLNGRFLLDQAILQDTTEDPNARDRTLSPSSRLDQSSAASFAAQLDRAILSRLARDIVANAFGEDALGDGTFDTGVNTITIETTIDATKITLVDNQTGETTTVTVPFF